MLLTFMIYSQLQSVKLKKEQKDGVDQELNLLVSFTVDINLHAL